uniref:Serine/threonine-protein phosphatase n=1 Tax=Elaeophora elaphi TaxID=1147741 RepID=A0A0R3RQF3_9BILA
MKKRSDRGKLRRFDGTLAERKKKVRKFLEKYIAVRPSELLRAPENNMSSMTTLAEVREICLRCREVFRMESILLRIDPPIYILGDIHGQFPDLVKIISKIGTPPRKRYLFMGDYVDRGRWSLETVSLLMAYKVRYPKHLYMLRGNHETRAVNRIYGFFEECVQRFPENNDGTQLWTLFQHAFNCMPFAALIGERIFAAHGGISEDLLNWNQFKRICRPTDVTDIGFINDLIWADPGNFPGKYIQSPRGVSQLFGKQATEEFQQKLNIDLIVRGHQVAQDGYELLHDKKCLTLFSAPYYCDELDNKAGILHISQSLHCTIYQFRGAKQALQSKEEKREAKHDKLLEKATPINGRQKESAGEQKVEPKSEEDVERSNIITDNQRMSNKGSNEDKKKIDIDIPMDEKNEEYDWKTQEE